MSFSFLQSNPTMNCKASGNFPSGRLRGAVSRFLLHFFLFVIDTTQFDSGRGSGSGYSDRFYRDNSDPLVIGFSEMKRCQILTILSSLGLFKKQKRTPRKQSFFFSRARVVEAFKKTEQNVNWTPGSASARGSVCIHKREEKRKRTPTQ